MQSRHNQAFPLATSSKKNTSATPSIAQAMKNYDIFMGYSSLENDGNKENKSCSTWITLDINNVINGCFRRGDSTQGLYSILQNIFCEFFFYKKIANYVGVGGWVLRGAEHKAG